MFHQQYVKRIRNEQVGSMEKPGLWHIWDRITWNWPYFQNFQTLRCCRKDESADLSWLTIQRATGWDMKPEAERSGWYEISTVRRAYHIRYDNFNLFEEIVPPLLELSHGLNKRWNSAKGARLELHSSTQLIMRTVNKLCWSNFLKLD